MYDRPGAPRMRPSLPQRDRPRRYTARLLIKLDAEVMYLQPADHSVA
jgi:hypothetical protein